MSEEKKTEFGALRLSVKGTNNGRGFDILYDFGKSHSFVEFTSKPEFLFIQPWMQFPAQEYSDECMRVSIELVRRFNGYSEMEARLKQVQERLDQRDKEARERYLAEHTPNAPAIIEGKKTE